MKISIVKLQDDFSTCCDFNKIAKENGKKFEIDCSEVYLRVRVDNCVFSSNSIEKCDFLFIRNFKCVPAEKTEFYFVELKGSDIDKALNQIIETISHIKKISIPIKKEIIFGFIISSKVPSSGTDITKIKQEFAKKY